jgi:hypothetical protein
MAADGYSEFVNSIRYLELSWMVCVAKLALNLEAC